MPKNQQYNLTHKIVNEIEKEISLILDGNAKKLVKWAETIVNKGFDKDISTSQIRNIYGTVKKLEMKAGSDVDKVIPDLILLKPKLAYVAGRHKKEGLKILRDILGKAIDLVAEDPSKRFFNFCKFFEAILAYHKAKENERR